MLLTRPTPSHAASNHSAVLGLSKENTARARDACQVSTTSPTAAATCSARISRPPTGNVKWSRALVTIRATTKPAARPSARM